MRVEGDVTVRDGILAFSRLTGKSVQEVSTETFGSVVNTLQKWTPPKNQRAGRVMIDRDLGKLFNTELTKLESFPAIENNVDIGTAFKLSGGGVVLALPDDIVTGVGYVEKIHQAHRRKSNGRVRAVSRPRKHGNWTRVRRRVVKPAVLNRYKRKEPYAEIGKAKAGFNVALKRLKVRDPGRWISRHGDTLGSVQVNLGEDGHGKIVVVNRVPYVKNKLSAGAINRAMNAGRKALFRKVQVEIRKNKDRAGFRRAA